MGATRFGPWWGNAADEFRRTKEQSSEEIDVVGSSRNRVVLVTEATWTAAPLGPGIVSDLERYKIPALRQAVRVVARPQLFLFCRSGYTPALRELAERESYITLVDVASALGGDATRE